MMLTTKTKELNKIALHKQRAGRLREGVCVIVFVRTTAVSNNYTREIITLACTNMHTHSPSRMHPLTVSFVCFWEVSSLFFVLFSFQINQTILNSRRGFDKSKTNKNTQYFFSGVLKLTVVVFLCLVISAMGPYCLFFLCFFIGRWLSLAIPFVGCRIFSFLFAKPRHWIRFTYYVMLFCFCNNIFLVKLDMFFAKCYKAW